MIRKIRGKKPLNQDHIAEITGVTVVSKPDHYQDDDTGEEFFHIAGGLAWPAADEPGFAVVVGAIMGGDPQEPALKVLDEVESSSIIGLLQECAERRARWGFPHLLHDWLGDNDRFHTIVTDFNADRKEGNVLIISPAYDLDKPNRGEIYLGRLQYLLKPGRSGQKRLFFGARSKISGLLQNWPNNAAQVEIEQRPAVAALGYVVHSMLVYKPWLQFLKPQKLISTMSDDDFLTMPLHEQQEIMKLLNLEWEEDHGDDDGGDGGLISTL
jgi:hypothetical protein